MAKKKVKRTQSRARHSYDPNLSPVGWYVGSFLLRFVEIGAKGNNNPKRRFLSWQNTILVKAKSLDHAFEKVVKVANSQTTPYKGGPDGIPVQWIFEGVTELLPVYEEIEDGSEIMWCERKPRTLSNLRKLVKPKSAFKS